MRDYDTPDPCGHHCDSSCPRCGDDAPQDRKPRKRTKTRRRACCCVGHEHDHGCPNGM
jgi:hypothetical protein